MPEPIPPSPARPAAALKLSADDAIRYAIRNGEQTSGPYTPEGLESLVYLGRVSPETLVSPAGQDAFQPIKETALARKLFPRLSEKAPPQHWARPGQSERVDRKHYQLTEAKFEKVNLTTGKPRVEVKEILDEIRQAEIAAGLDLPRPQRFKLSRRGRDFWIAAILGNTLLFGGGVAMQNPMSIVFGIAGSGLFTFGLLWSMYGVMDRY